MRIGECDMRKIIYTITMGVVMMCSLAACGKSKEESNDKTDATEAVQNTEESEDVVIDVDVQEVADKLLSDGDFKDELGVVDKTIAMTRLYGLDEAIVEAAAFYTNSNATAEEIAVIKVVGNEDVDTVKAAYENRIEEQKEACKDYLPDEMPKLKDAVIFAKGNYVVLCVSNDSKKAEDIIEKMFE